MIKVKDDVLNLDGKTTSENIQRYIQEAVARHNANGIIMGLSGGIDSALLAVLSVRALGKDRVNVYFLHDKNSEKDSMDKARLIAEWLGLKLNVSSIGAHMREKEKKALFFKFLSRMPTSTLPVIASLYYLVVGETPYITTLRREELKKNRFKRWVYNHIVAGLETMFDGPCEHRRIVLEKVAREKNMLLIGAGNRSEDLTGWFTINGIDNMPVSPIKCLYKTQVRKLAEYLQIPGAILKRPPSADVLRGATDTLALGMDFDKIDVILYGIESNFKDEDIVRWGVTKREIDKVRKIHHLSSWKRVS